ncbi:MAG TPA: hypothetical protein VMV84_07210, partial [Dehalococcoidales bacterium]|nr:hypothetical protein [Dehalococcoidales bacterium]
MELANSRQGEAPLPCAVLSVIGQVASRLVKESDRCLMLKAKCPKCGAQYVGWALSNLQHRKCSNCGEHLVVFATGKS